MTPDQIRASVRLGGRAAGGVVTQVRHMHHAVASRAFRPTGQASRPVRLVHDAIAHGAYGAVAGTFVLGGEAAGAVARVMAAGRRHDLGSTGTGNHALSAVNAVIGDWLAQNDDPLAITMSVRAGGHDLPLTADALARDFPDGGGRVVVFVHGLGENEHSWRRDADQAGRTLGSELAADLGYTPVYLRYNTGRHISDNGRDLAMLLDRLVESWPAPLHELSLIGHSMGGLVTRSACHYGAGNAWTGRVRHVVYLGSPHAGAPLARGARAVAWLLDKLPETRSFGALMDASPGIRDLRFGYVVEEDWADCDSGTCLDDHTTDLPLLASATHHVVSAAVARNPSGPAAKIVGDLLVQPASAHGRGRDRAPVPFEREHRHHHGGLHHFDLLNHPQIEATLRACLVVPVGTAPVATA